MCRILKEHKDHKGGWKIQLAMEISFVSSVKNSNKDSNKYINKDSNKFYPIHNSFIFIAYETNITIKELFKSLLEEYQQSWKTKIQTSDLVIVL